MTISFLHPTPFHRIAEFFRPGKKFLGYTQDREEIIFTVIDPNYFMCEVDGLPCLFEPNTWILTSDIAVLCQFEEIIPM